MIKDNEEHISDEIKTEIESKVSSLKTSLEGDDISVIENTLQELQETIQKVGAEVYANAQQAAGPETDPGVDTEAEDENTVEGNFRDIEEDEEKKDE